MIDRGDGGFRGTDDEGGAVLPDRAVRADHPRGSAPPTAVFRHHQAEPVRVSKRHSGSHGNGLWHLEQVR